MKIFANKLFTDSFLWVISSGVSALTRLLMVTVLARYFSGESYGVWVSITSVAAILMYGDFGITNALRNKVSELIAIENSENEQREYYYTVFYFFCVLSLFLWFIFLIFSKHFSIESLYRTTDIELQKEGVASFVLVQSVFILSIPWGIVNGLYFSYQEGGFLAVFNIIVGVFSLGLIFLCVYVFHFSLFQTAATFFSINLVSPTISTFFFLKKRRWLHNRIVSRNFFFIRIRELLIPSLKFLGVQLSGAFINNTPTIALGALVDLKTAASFNVVQKLYVFLITIYQSLFNPIWGRYGHYVAMGKWLELSRIDRNLLLLTVLFFSGFVLLFSFFTNPIIHLFVGKEYHSTFQLTFFLGVSYVFYMMYEASAIVQNSTGHIGLRLFIQGSVVLLLPYAIDFIYKKQMFGVEILLSLLWMLLFIVIRVQSFFIIRNKISN